MTNPVSPPDSNDRLFDPSAPGKTRRIYTMVVIVVVASLIVGIAGYAVWDRLF